MDERSIDCLVLYPNNQDRKVSAKLVTMLGTTFFSKMVAENSSLHLFWLGHCI